MRREGLVTQWGICYLSATPHPIPRVHTHHTNPHARNQPLSILYTPYSHTTPMSHYTQAFTHGIEGLDALSTGLCPGCEECASTFGYNSPEAFNAAYEIQAVHDEGSFSWQGCDLCGSTLGGTKYIGHYLDSNGDLCHLDYICVDCLGYMEYEEEPEDWDSALCRFNLEFEEVVL